MLGRGKSMEVREKSEWGTFKMEYFQRRRNVKG